MKGFDRVLLVVFLISSIVAVFPAGFVQGDAQSNDTYASSNAGIENVQASKHITGNVMDPALGTSCILDVASKANAESMLAIDPKNPSHLVGAAHFMYSLVTEGVFSGSVGALISSDGGQTWDNHLINGFDCNPGAGVKRSYDPVLAFDDEGNLYAAMLPAYGMGSEDNPIYVAKSTDGGATWKVANKGNRLFSPGSTTGSADKPWIVVDNNPLSPYHGTIYVIWVAFFGGYSNLGDILLSTSTDKGTTFSPPKRVSPAHTRDAGYFWPIPALAHDGTLNVNFATTRNCATCDTLDELVVKSTDGGNTFSAPAKVGTFYWASYPNTQFRTGIYQSFAVNPANGHLLVAVENETQLEKVTLVLGGYYYLAHRSNILIYESTDGGSSWTSQIVNDNPTGEANAFQPTVAVSPSGLVAVAFYDRRLSCPNRPWTLAADIGKGNVCIDTSIQFYTDQGSLSPVGGNLRVSKESWDPLNGGTLAKNSYLAFIGDYFGLALTDTMAYPFFTANYDLGQNPTHDMQIFLARVKTPVNLAATTTTTSTGPITVSQTSGLTGAFTTGANLTTTPSASPFGISGFSLPSILVGLGSGIFAIAMLRRRRRCAFK